MFDANFWVRTAQSLLALFLIPILVAACGPVSRPTQGIDSPTVVPPENPRPVAEPRTRLETPTAQVATSPEATPIGPREPVPQTVVLGSDSAWTSRSLPPKDPTRYRRWRQQARIRVGKSHLSTALPTFDEEHLVVMSQMEATVRIYDRGTLQLLGNYPVRGLEAGTFARGSLIPWPPTTGPVGFLVGNEEGIDQYDGLTGEFVRHLSDFPAWQMRYSPDRRLLVTSRSDISTQSSVMTFYAVNWEDQSLTAVDEIIFERRVDGFDISDDNRTLAVAFYPGDTLELIDLPTAETLWSVTAPVYSASVDISPDGTIVAVGGDRLLLVNAQDPTQTASYTGFNNNINTVRFSPSGDAVAASAYDGHLRIISAVIGPKKIGLKLLKDLRHGGTANVYSVSWIDGGGGIISSSGDETVRIWGR